MWFSPNLADHSGGPCPPELEAQGDLTLALGKPFRCVTLSDRRIGPGSDDMHVIQTGTIRAADAPGYDKFIPMPKTAKIAISLDSRLLERIERSRARTGESRSALVSRALLLLSQAEERQLQATRYVVAYHERPESTAEVSAARAAARRTLAHLPWDPR